MDDNIIVDAEEKIKREMRMKRFGVNDSEYLKKISEDKSLKRVPEDVNPLNPKENYKIMLDETKKNEIKFDKKKLMLYGVHLMNTEDIEKYLNEIEVKIKKIYWLNDFTCLVELDNEEISLNAFWKLTGTQCDKEKDDFDNYNWKKAKTYLTMNRELDIEIRVSVEGDLNKKSEKKESVYYKFYNKKKFNAKYYRQRGNRKRRYNNYNYNYNKNKRERSRDKEAEQNKSSDKIITSENSNTNINEN